MDFLLSQIISLNRSPDESPLRAIYGDGYQAGIEQRDPARALAPLAIVEAFRAAAARGASREELAHLYGLSDGLTTAEYQYGLLYLLLLRSGASLTLASRDILHADRRTMERMSGGKVPIYPRVHRQLIAQLLLGDADLRMIAENIRGDRRPAPVSA